MKIIITNQIEFEKSVDLALNLAQNNKTFECGIFMFYKNNQTALCHVFWDYTYSNKKELQVLFRKENIEKFNLNYKH